MPVYLGDTVRWEHGCAVRRTRRMLGRMARGLAIGGAVGLGVGIVISVLADVPLAPEAGLLLGLLAGWRLTRATG